MFSDCASIAPAMTWAAASTHTLLVRQAAGCASSMSQRVGKVKMRCAICHQTMSSICDCSGGAPTARAQLGVRLPQLHPARGEASSDHQPGRHPAHLQREGPGLHQPAGPAELQGPAAHCAVEP